MVITTIMPDEILRAPVAVRPQSLKSAHVSANASHIEAELLTGLAAEHHAENVNKHNNNTRSTSNLTMADNRKDVNKNRPKCSFQVLNKIGQGGYGSVYTVEKNEGVDQRTVYAMKVLNKSRVTRKPKEIEYVRAERYIMSKLRHPFIIGLNYAFQTSTQLFYVMDFARGGEVFNRLTISGAFPDQEARFYASEIICALEFLHNHNIVYRDLKPDNILIDEEGHVKLADFGLSKILTHEEDRVDSFNDGATGNGSSGSSCQSSGYHGAFARSESNQSIDENLTNRTRMSTRSCCGTLVYMAPEVIEKNPYGKAADVWSLGTVIYDMLVGQPPFHVTNKEKKVKCRKSDTNRNATKYNILHCNYYLPDHVSPTAKSLIQGLLQTDVDSRMGGYDAYLDTVKSHEFFAQINWAEVADRKLTPPHVPRFQGPTDVSHFDEKFTEDTNGIGFVIEASFRSDYQDEFKDFDYIADHLKSETKPTSDSSAEVVETVEAANANDEDKER